MGKRGPAPGTGGRPRKALQDKILEGNPSKRKIQVLEVPTLEGVEMPQPKEFLSEEQKDGHEFQAKKIYEETWHWLKERKCETLVSPSTLERYALSFARLIQTEHALSKYGFLSKHPTTGAAVTSPYVNIANMYMKQTNQLWNTIYSIVRENCSTDYEGSPHQDLMESLLAGGNLN